MKYLFIILIVTACGQSNKSATLNIPLSIDTNAAMINITDANAADTNKPSQNPLVGSWKSDCKDAEINELIYRENGTQALKVYGYRNDDPNCEGQMDIELTINRTYTFNDPNMDYTVVSYLAEPKSQIGVDNANQSEFFGFNSWTINQTKDVTGRGDESYKKGDRLFTIIKIDKNILYTGDTTSIHDGSSTDDRPFSYYDDMPFTKE